MSKVVVTAGVVTGMLGILSALNMQPLPAAASPADALRGVQSRSIQLEPTSVQPSTQPAQSSQPTTFANSSIGVSNPVDNQIVYERLSDEANLVVSPVKEDRELFGVSSAGVTGNNRVQVLYQPKLVEFNP